MSDHFIIPKKYYQFTLITLLKHDELLYNTYNNRTTPTIIRRYNKLESVIIIIKYKDNNFKK